MVQTYKNLEDNTKKEKEDRKKKLEKEAEQEQAAKHGYAVQLAYRSDELQFSVGGGTHPVSGAAVKAQDVFLFGGTLRENVAYGRLDATEEEILDAIEHAQLRPVLEAMPNGLALGSPILIELGHSPLSAISATLVLDALCTNFGAVGTPVWFGLGQALANSDGFSLSAARAQRVEAAQVARLADGHQAGEAQPRARGAHGPAGR